MPAAPISSALARPHLADPYWTLHAAAQLGYRGMAWPEQYLAGRDQLYRNLSAPRDGAGKARGQWLHLAGRHAIVTGGGRGIGAAIAAALAHAEARVTLMGRTAQVLQAEAERLRDHDARFRRSRST